MKVDCRASSATFLPRAELEDVGHTAPVRLQLTPGPSTHLSEVSRLMSSCEVRPATRMKNLPSHWNRHSPRLWPATTSVPCLLIISLLRDAANCFRLRSRWICLSPGRNRAILALRDFLLARQRMTGIRWAPLAWATPSRTYSAFRILGSPPGRALCNPVKRKSSYCCQGVP